MSDAFTGEIRAFGFGLIPRDWAPCQGQLLPVAAYSALFSVIGARFGGDGKNVFALPNLQGNAPMGAGAGPALTPRTVGDAVGTAAVSLLQPQMPQHSHAIAVQTASGTEAAPAGHVLAQGVQGSSPRSPLQPAYALTSPNTPLAAQALAPTTVGGQAHPNQQPYLALNFCICLNGEFPQPP